MSELLRRSGTALVYGAVVVLASVAPPPLFEILLAVAAAFAAAELAGLRRAGAAVWLEGALVVVGLASLLWLHLSWTAGAASSRYGVPLLFLAILPTWAVDVGAYLVGSTAGSRRIAPRISPGKTWEGTISGVVSGGLAALLLGGLGDGTTTAAALALLVGPVAFAGDLLESWVKRRAGVKDSGTLLPGHGGMLDRIDSLVAVAPLVAILYAVPCCASALG